jgi:hypothetical protein
MTGQLFSNSWHRFWDSVIRQAVGEVENLDRRLFSDPALAGALESIVSKYAGKIEIARLDRAGIEAVPVSSGSSMTSAKGAR